MFTGLVQHVGRIVHIEPTETGRSIEIDPAGWAHRAEPGESIAVNGACLTLVAAAPTWRFDVVVQTLGLTTLGSLRAGDRVNLEHAAAPATLLGGHLVQGHVDGVGAAMRVASTQPGEWRVRIVPPAHLMKYIVPQGSIAIDGVSLTIAAADDASFDIALIPETLERTTLSGIGEEECAVNIECDYLARMIAIQVERALSRR
jgi:riboflavin synthase